MTVIKFSYDIERDLKNYQNSLFEFKYPVYGRERPVVTGFLRSSFVRKVETAGSLDDKMQLAREYLDNFTAKHDMFVSSQLDSIRSYWALIEQGYIQRLENYFGVKIGFSEANCYLTTLTISPYNYIEKSFMTSMANGLAAQINTVMHEFMHLVFRSNFEGYCTDRGVDQQGVLEINESLTALLNYEFSEFTITPAFNKKPSTEDLQKRVVELWKEKKDFHFILDELIKMRTK